MSTPKIFIDMDGVLCDFDKKCREIFNINSDESVAEYKQRTGSNKFWKKIRETENFWSTLEPISDSILSFKKLSEMCPNISILSSPDERDPNCIAGKNKWIDSYLGPDTNRIFDKNKKQYAQKNYLLIDDFDKHIDGFRENGGYAILFTGSYDDDFWNQIYEFINATSNKQNTKFV